MRGSDRGSARATNRARRTINAQLFALGEGEGDGAHRGERFRRVTTSFLGVVYCPQHRLLWHNTTHTHTHYRTSSRICVDIGDVLSTLVRIAHCPPVHPPTSWPESSESCTCDVLRCAFVVVVAVGPAVAVARVVLVVVVGLPV